MPQPFQLETERLILRSWRDEDLVPFAEMNADPRVREFFPSVLTREESDREAAACRDKFDLYGYTFFAAEDRATHEFLGIIGILPLNLNVPGLPALVIEIGWRLKQAVWNRGLATEGARAVLDYAFATLNLDAVYAYTTVNNLPSRRVMEKLGLTHQFHLDFDHPRIPEGNPLRRHVIYRILRGDTSAAGITSSAGNTKAPTARSIPAWGNAPGNVTPYEKQGLKARPIGSSIPDVSFIELNSVLLQQSTEFILKRMPAVMRLLCIDVMDQGAKIGRPNGKRSITSLPRELRKRRRVGLQPFGRGFFEMLHQFRHICHSRKTNCEVNMIGYTSNPVTFASGIADNSGEIRIQLQSNILAQRRDTVLRAEDHVNQNKRKRLWHRRIIDRAFSPLVAGGASVPGALPQAGIAPRLWRSYQSACVAITLVVIAPLAGCKSSPAPTVQPATPAPTIPTVTYPARPATAPPPFRLFHHYDGSFTLTTKENATDDEIEAIVWELRDAGRNRSFDKLKVSQKDVDAGGSTVWFHIYRGTKCAPEKYAEGKPPCGASYHAAGDYTLSKVNGQPWDKGVLLHEEKETLLWNSDAPYTPSSGQ